MTYPTEDTLMTVREIYDRYFHLLRRADIRLQDFTRSRYRLPVGTWIVRKWEHPTYVNGQFPRRVRAHVSLMGKEETQPIVLPPEEMLLVKGLPD